MEPGDLVQFDVRANKNMRLASSPRLVSSDEYPTLAHDLKQAGMQPEPSLAPQVTKPSAKIVAFEPKSRMDAPKHKLARRVI